MGLRWIGRLALALALFISVAGVARAQSGDVTVDNNGCDIDESDIRSAAGDLEDKGAHVVVVCTDSAGGDALDYLDERISDLGVGSGHTQAQLDNNAIVLFVSNEPRYVSLARGNGWTSVSDAELENVRQQYLVPQLRRGDFTAAFVDGIHQTNSLARELATRPSSGGGTSGGGTSQPSSSSPFIWIVLGLLVVGGAAAFIVPPFLRKRQQKEAAATVIQQARERYEAARLAAGAAIADGAKVLDDARLKQKFDASSYTHEDVQWLDRRQAQGEQLFARAQQEFDKVEERLLQLSNPAEQDYQSAVVEYERARDTALQARERLTEVDNRRNELDAANRAAPGEVGGIKKP